MADQDNTPTPQKKPSAPLLNASETPDLDVVEQAWNDFLAADEAGSQGVTKAARARLGLGTPSSVVGSAEGVAQFEGLRINGNGRLDDVHTAILKRKIGEFGVDKAPEQSTD